MTAPVIVTHNGSFHADDVFAVALLKRMHPEASVIRTRDEEEIASADFVVDVGGVFDPQANRFDHHQPEGAGVRENGIPYASVGLVWQIYGAQIAGSEEVAALIDEYAIQEIDAYDSGVAPFETTIPGMYPKNVGTFVQSFNAPWNVEDPDHDALFEEVVAVASVLFERILVHASAKYEGEKLVREAYENADDATVLVLDRKLPYHSVLASKPETKFVIHPDPLLAGRWRAYALAGEKAFEYRIRFPKAWAGLHDTELQTVSGVQDAVFCHRACFLVVADSFEGITQLVQLALNEDAC